MTTMYDFLLREMANQMAAHIDSLIEDGSLTRQRSNVVISHSADLLSTLARMEAPRHTYHNMLLSTDLVSSIATALGAVRWGQVVADMKGHQPERLSRPECRHYHGLQHTNRDEGALFARLRLAEAATLPEALLFAMHVSLRASCGGFFQSFHEPDLLPQLSGEGGRTNIWAVLSRALTALLEAHPEGLGSTAPPNAAYMADDILHVEATHLTMAPSVNAGNTELPVVPNDLPCFWGHCI